MLCKIKQSFLHRKNVFFFILSAIGTEAVINTVPLNGIGMMQ
jgi:hypothetical protein